MMGKLVLAALTLIALFALVGCNKGDQTPTAKTDHPTATRPGSSVATGGKSCCQCPGVWNDPPTNPPTYKLQPDCADSSPGETACEADCKSKGYPSGALASGTCQPAKSPGVGSICQ